MLRFLWVLILGLGLDPLRSAAPAAPGIPGMPAAPVAPALPHGIRGEVDIPDPWKTWRLVGLMVILLAICALGFWLWWRRRGSSTAGPGARPDDVARARLQRALALVDEPKPFIAEVSEAVRVYLEQRFGLRAPERTTEEFVAELQQNGALAGADRELLAKFLGACDLIKFADMIPGRLDLDELHTAALRLVNDLTPAARPASEAPVGSIESVQPASPPELPGKVGGDT